MNNQIKVFASDKFGDVRIVQIDSEPWFVGKDVAEILGYRNPNEAIQDHVDSEDKFIRSQRGSEMLKLFSSLKDMQEKLGRQDNWFINESGVYSLIFGSKLPQAKEFKYWVTHEVLPSIRKHGAYLTDNALEEALTSPDFLIKLATQLKEEKEARLKAEQKTIEQEKTIEVLKPKADYTDMILKNNSLVTITQIAKDYGMSGKAMNSKLHEMKIIYNLNGQWLLYSKYQSQGYVHSETFPIKHKNGYEDAKMNTKWTQKGRLFLYERLKAQGITPIIERMTR